jgi:hypothetical protein
VFTRNLGEKAVSKLNLLGIIMIAGNTYGQYLLAICTGSTYWQYVLAICTGNMYWQYQLVKTNTLKTKNLTSKLSHALSASETWTSIAIIMLHSRTQLKNLFDMPRDFQEFLRYSWLS